jgi:hypothetical protein
MSGIRIPTTKKASDEATTTPSGEAEILLPHGRVGPQRAAAAKHLEADRREDEEDERDGGVTPLGVRGGLPHPGGVQGEEVRHAGTPGRHRPSLRRRPAIRILLGTEAAGFATRR